MIPLPQSAHPDHLRKQAKDLLRAFRLGEPEALARVRRGLPAMARLPAEAAASFPLRLHDAQSCLAREYGFASWPEMMGFLQARAAGAGSMGWLRLVYGGDVTGGIGGPRPAAAARLLRERPGLASGDVWLACAVGDEAALRRAIAADPGVVAKVGGALRLPPLIAVTHSSLGRLPGFRDGLRACARLLLAAGADPTQRIGNRMPPASVAAPDETQPLSALYGAVGIQRDPAMAALLLDAGATPDDGESLYHSVEEPACTRLLLERGAKVAGTNALFRALDLPGIEALELLLAHGGQEEDLGKALLWGIRRRRSLAHVEALLAAGADPCARTREGMSAWRYALQYGLTEVAARLAPAGEPEELDEAARFVAACARGDEAEAARIRAARPDLPGALPESQLRLLPEMAAAGHDTAVRAMVRQGWPLEVRGGDWKASALNLAVFRGDAEMAEFLLAHGASRRTEHGFGDDAIGTLSWASLNEPEEGGDWVGCAEALLAHGLPLAEPVAGARGEADAGPLGETGTGRLEGTVAEAEGRLAEAGDPEPVMLEGKRRVFSPGVREVLLRSRS
ncbi:ankyrin repeat domain-containing protein [Acetobacteraceae bacterium H6797]|nr:ankyrin repeat domain-containing protein [Acetobacteraceae bacterium H6797]